MNEILLKIKLILKELMIDLTEEEIILISNELSESVNQLNAIKDINFDLIEDMNFDDIKVNNLFREDEIIDFNHKKELLENPKEVIKNLVKV